MPPVMKGDDKNRQITGAREMTKTYLEADEIESLEKAATNLRDRPPVDSYVGGA